MYFEGEMHDAFKTPRTEFESLANGAGATVIDQHHGITDEHDSDTTIVIVLSDVKETRRKSKYIAVDPDYLLDCILDYKVHNFQDYDVDGDEEESESDEVEEGKEPLEADANAGQPSYQHNASQDLTSSPPLF